MKIKIFSFLMDTWYCESCNVTLKTKSKYAHVKSKKHLKNIKLVKAQENTVCNAKHEVKQEDCVICCDSSAQFEKCKGCNQEWCKKCDKNIFECPYCRHIIEGREEQSRRQKHENFEWQVNDEVFRTTQPNQSNQNRISVQILDIFLNRLIYDMIYRE